MTEEKPKGPEWVLEQLENIAECMLPSETCIDCKECSKEAFEKEWDMPSLNWLV